MGTKGRSDAKKVKKEQKKSVSKEEEVRRAEPF
jgi:hypothetical protein